MMAPGLPGPLFIGRIVRIVNTSVNTGVNTIVNTFEISTKFPKKQAFLASKSHVMDIYCYIKRSIHSNEPSNCRASR